MMSGTTTILFDPVRGDSEPGRFWSTTNTAEATPLVLTPLCWSVWGDGLESAWLRSMGDFGVLSGAEQEMSSDMNRRSTAAIYGRQAVNVDVLRGVLARLPGVDPDAVERDLLGSKRTGLPVLPRHHRRLPIIAARLPITLLSLNSRHSAMIADQRMWWRTEVFGVGAGTCKPNGTPLQRLRVASARFAAAMRIHSIVRFLLPAAEGAVLSAGDRHGAADPAAAALRGFGDVTEMAMADALWELATKPGAIDDFLSEYGFHGPNEGNVYTCSWREDPTPIHKLIEMYRARPDILRPGERSVQCVWQRRQAERELFAAIPALTRPGVRFMLARAASLTRKLELSKAAYLMALDGCRGAARDLGAKLIRSGRIADADDVFFLTVEELAKLDGDGSFEVGDLVEFRRSQRLRYERICLPVSFTGIPEPTEKRQSLVSDRGMPLTGAASGGGLVHGRARVIHDPDDDIELDKSDILVCRFTDPSWTPLMSLAAALVIDIGSQSSHGAVIARELGVPYVIGTEVGTSVIKTGDALVVDGRSGTVSMDSETESSA